MEGERKSTVRGLGENKMRRIFEEVQDEVLRKTFQNKQSGIQYDLYKVFEQVMLDLLQEKALRMHFGFILPSFSTV